MNFSLRKWFCAGIQRKLLRNDSLMHPNAVKAPTSIGSSILILPLCAAMNRKKTHSRKGIREYSWKGVWDCIDCCNEIPEPQQMTNEQERQEIDEWWVWNCVTYFVKDNLRSVVAFCDPMAMKFVKSCHVDQTCIVLLAWAPFHPFLDRIVCSSVESISAIKETSTKWIFGVQLEQERLNHLDLMTPSSPSMPVEVA